MFKDPDPAFCEIAFERVKHFFCLIKRSNGEIQSSSAMRSHPCQAYQVSSPGVGSRDIIEGYQLEAALSYKA